MTRSLPISMVENAEKLKTYFKFHPDFPKAGVTFWDVFALYKNKEAFKLLNTLICEYADLMKGQVDVIVAIDSRGFLLGPALASYMNCTLTAVRKRGKLPGPVKQIRYDLEYGTDVLELQEDSIESGQRVIIVDDCIATGGSLNAACKLVETCGGIVTDCLVLYTIPGLDGLKNVNASVTSLC